MKDFFLLVAVVLFAVVDGAGEVGEDSFEFAQEVHGSAGECGLVHRDDLEQTFGECLDALDFQVGSERFEEEIEI